MQGMQYEWFLFPKLKASSGNLRTTFHKIIERAGHKPWPRLFQNLRGSCETDWVDDYPSHQVASWLGHSPSIAARHYLKHKDLHVQAATGTGDWIQHKGIKKPAGAKKKVSKISGAESGAFEVQNAVQHPAAPTCMFSQFGTQPLAPYDVVRGLATVCKTLQSETMGEEDHHHSLELMLMHGLHRRERFPRGSLFLGIGSIQS